MKNILLSVLGVATTVTILSGAVGLYLVKKFTTRPIYSAQRIKEHEHNRVVLLNEFKAKPITLNTEDNVLLSGLLIISHVFLVKISCYFLIIVLMVKVVGII